MAATAVLVQVAAVHLSRMSLAIWGSPETAVTVQNSPQPLVRPAVQAAVVQGAASPPLP
jgi:hypothetical protein